MDNRLVELKNKILISFFLPVMEWQQPRGVFREKRCLFCQEMITHRPGELINLQTHLRITHEISHHEDFALHVLFLNIQEIEEMQRRLEPRLEEFRSEKDENVSDKRREEKELKDIQASLMGEMENSDSDDCDDKKEENNSDTITRTIIKEERCLDRTEDEEVMVN